jgi:hypothetical protein
MEQHFALVAEVAEEGSFGETHRLGDVSGRGLFVAAGGEQLQRGVL